VQLVRHLVALWQHATGVVEPVIVPGHVFEVAGDAVRFPQRGGGFQHPRKLADVADQRALALVGQ
jgi:hypothetical protein